MHTKETAQVIWAPSALDDIATIGEYIACDPPK